MSSPHLKTNRPATSTEASPMQTTTTETATTAPDRMSMDRARLPHWAPWLVAVVAAALSALLGELRKIAACLETTDDGEAGRRAGLRGRPNLYHARRRAREMGQTLVLRLLNGAILASRQFRQSGTSPEVVLETLVLHAQRLIRSRVR